MALTLVFYSTKVSKSSHCIHQSSKINLFLQDNLPSQSILLSGLERGPGLDNIVFNKTNDWSKTSAEPFFSYWRMTAAVAEKHLYVDFDLHLNRWRTLNVTFPPSQPETGRPKAASTTLDRMGTWTKVTKDSPHLHFDGLDLQIPNFYYFDKHCFYQPFMTVFSTDGMNASEVQRQSDEKWSPKGKSNVVMRTASFGKSPFQVEACIRRWDYSILREDNKVEVKQGMGDDMIVPLGLIAAMRLQMKEDGRHPKACDMVGRLF
jgi:hypothetical protein